jgi:hypothetical protein
MKNTQSNLSVNSLNTTTYEITVEQGVIPMTTYRFDQHHTPLVHRYRRRMGKSQLTSFKLRETS